MTTIYLIRHGQASIGTSNYDVLSALGRKQSALLGAYFRKTNLRFDRVFSGALQRQIDTASISLNLEAGSFSQWPAFNEYQHSKIFDHYAALMAKKNEPLAATLADGHNSKLTYEVFATLMNAWARDGSTNSGFESWNQFKARIHHGLTDIFNNDSRDQRIAIYTSGGVICTILQMIANFPTEKVFELNWGIYNAGITTIKRQGSMFKLRTYNSIAHLEIENDSCLITNI